MTDFPNYPWLQFQISLLDDPDYMLLSDSASGIYTKLYLLAGRADAGGLLCNAHKQYTVKDLAFILRVDRAKMETYLAELAASNLVTKEGEAFKITRFLDEQGPGQGANKEAARADWNKRQQRHRERVKKTKEEKEKEVENINSETVTLRDVTPVSGMSRNVTVTENKEPPPPPFKKPGVDFFDEKQIPELRPDQRDFLAMVVKKFAPKKFMYYEPIKKLLGLREKFPEGDVLEALEWAIGKEMVPGEAVDAIAKALPDWKQTKDIIKTGKKNGNSGRSQPEGIGPPDPKKTAGKAAELLAWQEKQKGASNDA